MKKFSRPAVILMTLALLCAMLCLPAGADNALEAENEPLTAAEEASLATAEPIAEGQSMTINAKAAVLMEVSTGRLLFELSPHEQRAPASITKVMTALLTLEAVEEGRISLDDMVTVSEHAQSLGGTTIFLEAGEQMSVDDLMKGLMVNSANDAAVALAEHIGGTEESFVGMMNERAKELGMEHTHFMNSHGLDADGHYSSAYDIGLMSVALLKHEKILDYTRIWTGSLRNGQTELANTNRLIRFYEYATGLKTGTTANSGRCVSASAMKDGLHLVSVVLDASEKHEQFNAARGMLEWGFAHYQLIDPPVPEGGIPPVKILRGTAPDVEAVPGEAGKVLIEKGLEKDLTSQFELAPDVEAPVEKGQILGSILVMNGSEIVSEIPLVAAEAVDRMTFGSAFQMLWRALTAASA